MQLITQSLTVINANNTWSKVYPRYSEKGWIHLYPFRNNEFWSLIQFNGVVLVFCVRPLLTINCIFFYKYCDLKVWKDIKGWSLLQKHESVLLPINEFKTH